MKSINKINSIIIYDDNGNHNLLFSDDYITAIFKCDADGAIIPPGCISAKVHITREQNAIDYRLMKSVTPNNITLREGTSYLLPGLRCKIEVDDELKITNKVLIGDSENNTIEVIFEHMYVDAADYESIDGSRTEFIKNRIDIFNEFITSYQKNYKYYKRISCI